jgi:hypothetical protein
MQLALFSAPLTNVLKDEQGNYGVLEEVRRKASEGQPGIARGPMRGKYDEIAPLRMAELEKSLPLIGAQKDDSSHGSPFESQPVADAVQIAFAADFEARGESSRSFEVLGLSQNFGGDELPDHEGE